MFRLFGKPKPKTQLPQVPITPIAFTTPLETLNTLDTLEVPTTNPYKVVDIENTRNKLKTYRQIRMGFYPNLSSGEYVNATDIQKEEVNLIIRKTELDLDLQILFLNQPLNTNLIKEKINEFQQAKTNLDKFYNSNPQLKNQKGASKKRKTKKRRRLGLGVPKRR
jgi:hypothetical protein